VTTTVRRAVDAAFDTDQTARPDERPPAPEALASLSDEALEAEIERCEALILAGRAGEQAYALHITGTRELRRRRGTP
jgi:hypothetical protein